MKAHIRFASIFLFLSITLCCFSQGKIEKSKEEIKNGKKGDTTQINLSSTSSGLYKETSIGNWLLSGVAKGFLYITYYSVIGNYKIESHLHNTLTKHPYYKNSIGNYEDEVDTSYLPKNHFRIDLDYQYIYSNRNLTGDHFKLTIRPFHYFYLQAQYRELTEYVSKTASNISLFNFNFCYDRIRFRKFNLGWKLGMYYIPNNLNMAGLSLGVIAEVFLIKPFSLYTSMQWGSINNVGIKEYDLGARFHFKRYQISLGYEHLNIGSPLYDFIFLGAGIHI